MQKLDKSASRIYNPLVIWPDQLRELVNTLSTCTEISLVADNVKYDSIDEFLVESRGRSPKSLEIKAHKPYLTVDFDRFSARLYVSSTDLIGSGLFAKLDALLCDCERRPRLLYRFTSAWIASLTLPNVFYIPFLKPYQWWSLVLSLVTLAWMIIIGYVHLRRRAVVKTQPREQQRSFIQRNADGIIIAAVSALLGAAFGAIATKVADRYWPTLSTSAPNPPPTTTSPSGH